MRKCSRSLLVSINQQFYSPSCVEVTIIIIRGTPEPLNPPSSSESYTHRGVVPLKLDPPLLPLQLLPSLFDIYLKF